MPSLQRLYNEFVSFMGNALTDLDQSIQRLEKARTDYRAALLWMRDVSAKLQNPDHRDELVKFRQVHWEVKQVAAPSDIYQHFVYVCMRACVCVYP